MLEGKEEEFFFPKNKINKHQQNQKEVYDSRKKKEIFFRGPTLDLVVGDNKKQFFRNQMT